MQFSIYYVNIYNSVATLGKPKEDEPLMVSGYMEAVHIYLRDPLISILFLLTFLPTKEVNSEGQT